MARPGRRRGAHPARRLCRHVRLRPRRMGRGAGVRPGPAGRRGRRPADWARAAAHPRRHVVVLPGDRPLGRAASSGTVGRAGPLAGRCNPAHRGPPLRHGRRPDVSIDATIGLFSDDDLVPQAGHPDRFGRRWRLVGAGLSDVWRYGDLLLPAASGRLLLRGPNGTGKTTALEALWPYLLDLNAQRLAAGKARPTSLSQLRREGAPGRRRYGYVWLTFAGPGSEGEWSFGVRLQFSEGASPSVRVVPFTVPGVPGTTVPLRGPGRTQLMAEEFTAAVEATGGQVFDDEDAYVEHLARRVWGTGAAELRLLATRLRELRNPSLLGEVSARAAADALRESLPGVSDDVISATADALAESDATREAFRRDSEAAAVLGEFAAAWTGHVIDVTRVAVADARDAAEIATRARGEVGKAGKALEAARKAAVDAGTAKQELQNELRDLEGEIEALERSDEYQAAGRLQDLQKAADAQRA